MKKESAFPKQVILQGKTLHGKNNISKQGSTWHVELIQEQVLFSSKPGPWLFLKANHFSRWVHLTSDPNFQITSLSKH